VKKDSNDEIAKREAISTKYRWEFERRNKNYIKDYSSVKYAKSRSKVSRFKTKWAIGQPIDPALKFEDLQRLDRKKQGDQYIRAIKEPFEAVTEKYNLKDLTFGNMFNIMEAVPVTISIHQPKQKILDEIESLIDKWHKKLNKEFKKYRLSLYRFRVQFDQYDNYLKIYDLIESGYSHEDVARKVYMGYIESSGIYYAKRKVKRDYERCEKLIESDFRQIG